MERRRSAVLLILVSALTFAVLVDLESRGFLTPVILPRLAGLTRPIADAVRGHETVVAGAAILGLLVFLISRNPPWLPTGYLWVEWDRWEKIGKVRPGYFKFRLLGREFKGVDCGSRKIVFLEGDPEDYEVLVSDRSEVPARIFGVSLEQRVLGSYFKPKYKVYAARVLDDPDEIVEVGWGGRKNIRVDEESGEIFEDGSFLDERPDGILTRREILRGIISKMKNVVWVVPRWRSKDLKRLAEEEINYMDVMVDAEKAVRRMSDLSHSMLEAYRRRVYKSIAVSLLSHLDACKQAFDEIDSAYAILAHLFNIEIGELRRSLSAAGIKMDEKVEDVIEQWLNQEERRRQLMERYRRLTSVSGGTRKRKGLLERIKEMLPSKEEGQKAEGQS